MKAVLIAFVMVVSFAVVGMTVAPVTYAINVFSGGQPGSETVTNKGGSDFQTTVGKIVSTLLFAVGAIAVIAIVMGGLRYIMSDGDQGAIKGAKDTILYACVGLAVALLAYAIVNFVVARFK